MMNKKKSRFLRLMAATILVFLTCCILFFCFTTLGDNEAVSNDVASEITPHGTETRTPVGAGASQKPSFGQLWSRSEVFMY